MTTSRAEQIDLSATPYYHCITRCVRGSFLCGIDYDTGRDYSHRKPWIVARMKALTNAFAIKICAYAVMSNHYHLVLYVNAIEADTWSDDAVRSRWGMLFCQDAKDLDLLSSEKQVEKIKIWRERLTNISWFMRCLNEYIARISNREDEIKGRFWEARFKSQALLDEGAVLSAMAYVDLNPIRAKLAATPEESEFTSIYERIQYVTKQCKEGQKTPEQINKTHQPSQLMPFENFASQSKQTLPMIDFKLSDYLHLVDVTGRMLREDKRGSISLQLPPMLTRLNLNAEGWFDMVRTLEETFSYAVGHVKHLVSFAGSLKGTSAAKRCYAEAA